MTTERVINIHPGHITRFIDRLKRPLFMIGFLTALLGVLASNLQFFLGGTATFMLTILIHLFMRRSNVPLLGHYLGLGRYLRVTRSGKMMLALTLIIGLTGVNARINLLLLVLGMLLGVIMISGILSENSLRRLSVRLYLPSTAYASTPFAARLTIRNGKKRMPSYSLSVEITYEGPKGQLLSRSYVLKVPPRRTVTLEQLIRIDARGRHRVRRVRIGTRFPFGFFEKWSYYGVDGEVLMLPRLGRICGRVTRSSDRFRFKGASKVLNKAGHDEFWGIREYREGDNPRLIHWRSSARLGKRVIRELHREETQRYLILLDACVPDPGDNEMAERFETAVSFAATLARYLLDQEYQVALAAHGQQFIKLRTDKGKRQVSRAMRALAEIEPSRDVDFSTMLREVDPRLRADALAVAIVLEDRRMHGARADLDRTAHGRVQIVSVDGPTFNAMFARPQEAP